MNYTVLNNNLNLYFKEIRNFSNLTREDEVVLFGRIAKGDKYAETELFNKVAKLAVAVAKTYTGESELLEDIIQEANIGILAAIRKFDLNMGYRFSSYARWWMKAYISTFLKDLGIVHPSSNALINLANSIKDKFYRENNREISEYELMDLLEEQGQVVTDVTAITNVVKVSIDQPVGDEDEMSKSECGEFADRTASVNDYEKEMDDEFLSSCVEKLLEGLTDKERKYVKMNFGIGQDYEMTYKQIAEAEGCTQERVRQIVTGALKKMKK
jgi:RNA polymerase primary sigma factor